MIAELLGTTKNNVSMHLSKLFVDGEIYQKATVKDFLTVQNEGTRKVERSLIYYNLDAIISVTMEMIVVIIVTKRYWYN